MPATPNENREDISHYFTVNVRGAVEFCDRLGIDYFKDSFRTFNVSSREVWRFLNDRDSSRRLHNDPDRLLMDVHIKALILEICSRRSDDCGGQILCAPTPVSPTWEGVEARTQYCDYFTCPNYFNILVTRERSDHQSEHVGI